jgi:hypothetical protein
MGSEMQENDRPNYKRANVIEMELNTCCLNFVRWGETESTWYIGY